jgi:hypothetical protein
MDLDHRITAAHACDKVRNHLGTNHAFDDPEDGRFFLDVEIVRTLQQLMHAQVILVNLQHLDQCGFRDLVVLEPVEELVDVVIGRAAKRPCGAFDDTLVAVGEAFAVVIQRLVVDERGQNIHEHHRM